MASRLKFSMTSQIHDIIFRQSIRDPPGQTGTPKIMKFTLVNFSMGQNSIKLTIKIVDRTLSLQYCPFALLSVQLYAIIASGRHENIWVAFRLALIMLGQQ